MDYICHEIETKLILNYSPHIVNYLKAGKLLHFITLVELGLAYVLISFILKIETFNLFQLGLKIYGICFFSSLPVLAQLDARSRYQNFKQLKDQFILYGYDTRILKPVIKSRCQRDAAILAAHRTGFGAQCENHFYKAGYRWYHLLPDFVFSHPQFLFTVYFWKTTFFCPTYRSKLNLETPELLSIQTLELPSIVGNG